MTIKVIHYWKHCFRQFNGFPVLETAVKCVTRVLGIDLENAVAATFPDVFVHAQRGDQHCPVEVTPVVENPNIFQLVLQFLTSCLSHF
jgi:hypothetical protein